MNSSWTPGVLALREKPAFLENSWGTGFSSPSSASHWHSPVEALRLSESMLACRLLQYHKYLLGISKPTLASGPGFSPLTCPLYNPLDLSTSAFYFCYPLALSCALFSTSCISWSPLFILFHALPSLALVMSDLFLFSSALDSSWCLWMFFLLSQVKTFNLLGVSAHAFLLQRWKEIKAGWSLEFKASLVCKLSSWVAKAATLRTLSWENKRTFFLITRLLSQQFLYWVPHTHTPSHTSSKPLLVLVKRIVPGHSCVSSFCCFLFCFCCVGFWGDGQCSSS